jgi:hypothetical protein
MRLRPTTAVTVTAQVSDTDGDALTVTWEVDGVLVQTLAVAAGGPPTLATLSLPHGYTVGTHTVNLTATDGKTLPVSCSTTVTIRDTTPPT